MATLKQILEKLIPSTDGTIKRLTHLNESLREVELMIMPRHLTSACTLIHAVLQLCPPVYDANVIRQVAPARFKRIHMPTMPYSIALTRLL